MSNIIVYNPKFLTVNGRKTLNNTNVRDFIWSHKKWFLKAGEMFSFPSDVGRAMLRHMEFLIEVNSKNYDQIKKETEEKAFKCDKCDFETSLKMAFINHYKTHNKEEEKVNFNVPEAKPVGEFYGMAKSKPNPEGEIPQGGTKRNPVEDRDGVGWYGPGQESDSE